MLAIRKLKYLVSYFRKIIICQDLQRLYIPVSPIFPIPAYFQTKNTGVSNYHDADLSNLPEMIIAYLTNDLQDKTLTLVEQMPIGSASLKRRVFHKSVLDIVHLASFESTK